MQLETLQEVLQSIDETIVMSESDKSHLGMVLCRWASILAHLIKMNVNFLSLSQNSYKTEPFRLDINAKYTKFTLLLPILHPSALASGLIQIQNTESIISSINIQY